MERTLFLTVLAYAIILCKPKDKSPPKKEFHKDKVSPSPVWDEA